MEHPIHVHIFGAPTAECDAGVTDPWQKMAAWVGRQLATRFGERVSVEYFDLFSPEMDRFPEVMTLVSTGRGEVPLVLVGHLTRVSPFFDLGTP
ncbi:MAG: hypothetical protein ACP5JJ_19040, partial [Anaerolineae bacterium]